PCQSHAAWPAFQALRKSARAASNPPAYRASLGEKASARLLSKDAQPSLCRADSVDAAEIQRTRGRALQGSSPPPPLETSSGLPGAPLPPAAANSEQPLSRRAWQPPRSPSASREHPAPYAVPPCKETDTAASPRQPLLSPRPAWS